MKILLLNQYGPSDASPTARLLADLAEDLKMSGHTVRIACASSDYRHGKVSGWRRWVRELAGLGKILAAGLSVLRPDVVISFSSPPGLIILATFLAKWHRTRSIHWALDLYPDLARALGELKKGRLEAWMTHLTRWGYDQTDIVVTLDEDMRDRLRLWGTEAEILPPWPPLRQKVTIEKTPPATPPHWLYSGNLGRAHEWRALLEIQKIIEAHDPEIELVVQGGGAAWPLAQACARQLGLQRCRWRDYAGEEQLVETLARATVLVVTQRPEVKGMLWPSKLAVLPEIPRPVLWIGPVPSAVASWVKTRAGSAAFTPGEVDRAAAWIMESVRAARQSPLAAGFSVAPRREKALGQWRELVRRDRALPLRRF